MSISRPMTIQQVQRVAGLLAELLSAPSLQHARELLQDHDELISDVALALLADLKRRVTVGLGPEIIMVVDATAGLIRRSREIGVDAAVHESESGLLEMSQPAVLEEAAAYVTPPRDLPELDGLLERIERAVLADPPGDGSPTDHAALLHEAGRLRHLRWRASGEHGDLDEAINRLRAAAAMGSPTAPLRARVQAALGEALTERYDITGDRHSLDEAVAAYEAALDSGAVTSTALAGETLGGLASALLERYLRDGRIEDIDEAAEHAARAADVSEPGSPELTNRLVTLVSALIYRYRRTGMLSDLDGAVDAAERACEAAPADGPDVTVLTSCANARRERYAVTGDLRDLNTAIDAYQEVLDRSPTGSAAHVDALSNVAAARLERALTADGAEAEADVQAAVELARYAVVAMADDDPNAVGHLGNLALALRTEAERRERPKGIEEATAAYRRAAAVARQRVSPVGVLVACQWGAWAAGRGAWSEAAEAYSSALEVRAQLLARASSWRDRESYLTAVPNLPEHAAHVLARAGRHGEAVLALERSRVVLLDEALARHGPDVSALEEAGHGDLAQAFASAVTSDLTSQLRSAPAETGCRPARTGASVHRLVEEIRGLPGFQDFLSPPSLGRVMAAARGHPLVYLGAAAGCGVAVAVRGAGTLQSVLLPELSAAAVREQVSLLLRAHDVRDSDEAGWRQALDALLRWTWEAAMAPVLEAVPEGRLGLLPMGLLTMIPLHAAWTPDTCSPSGRRYVLDSHVVDYPCSARHLAPRPRAPRDRERVLQVLGPPLEAGGAPAPALEFARLDRVEEVTQLRGGATGRHTVLAALASHSVAHLSCEVRIDLIEPLTTALLLNERDRLTVRSLATACLQPGPRLAVLPAARSALPGASLPAELLGLPAALHAAGTSAVVANLWDAPSTATAALLADFYARWSADPDDPAQALAEAQRHTRDATTADLRPVELVRGAGLARSTPFAHPVHWAGFVCSRTS